MHCRGCLDPVCSTQLPDKPMNRIQRRSRPRAGALVAIAAVLAAAGCSDGPAAPAPGTNPALEDTAAPERVVGPVLEWQPAAARALLSWRAPSDDPGHAGPVASYDIRYSYSYPLKWDRALALAAPAPAAPGTQQSATIPSPRRGRDVYAAIRSFDSAGNASVLSDLAVAHIPGLTLTATCTRTGTGAPTAGLAVRITARRVRVDTTGADGTFTQSDITAGLVTVEITRGTSAVPWHTVRDAFTLAADTSIAYPMIEFQASPSGQFESILSLLVNADAGVNASRRFRKWASLPVDVYVPAFTNTLGVDYGAAVRAAIDRWELRTGIDLFRVVGSVPARGVEFRYLPRSQMGIQNGFTEHFDGADGLPSRDIVRILDEFSDADKLYRIMMHELGHTIRLQHLPAGFIMYGGQPLPADISDDEVLLVQLHAALPNNFDLGPYVTAPPTR